MSKIRIKNFGPIKDGFDTEDGFMDIKKVTVFIGDQGTGKSTVAKLISTLIWTEKAFHRGDIHMTSMTFDLLRTRCKYQVIHNYFLPETEIEYSGDLYYFKYKEGENTKIERHDDKKYVMPQIAYISSERNFLSTVKTAYEVKGLPNHLFNFAEEYRRAQIELKGEIIDLPLKKYKYEYDVNRDKSIVIGNNHKIDLFEASSGLQSLVPMYLVSRNLSLYVHENKDEYRENLTVTQAIRRNEEIAQLMADKFLSAEEKAVKVTEILSRFQPKCFINIVEEPEQNLFPTSQRHMLNSLVEFANMNEGNKLIMTTHSPYILGYLGIAVQGNSLLEKINAVDKPDEFKERLEKVVPIKSVIKPDDIIVYQLNENGTISRLPDYEGIPADKNFLNQSLVESNQLFDALLEIEEDL